MISNIAENYIANIGNLLDLKVLQKPDIFESYNSNLSYIPFYEGTLTEIKYFEPFNINIHLNQRVEKLSKEGNNWKLTTNSKNVNWY